MVFGFTQGPHRRIIRVVWGSGGLVAGGAGYANVPGGVQVALGLSAGSGSIRVKLPSSALLTSFGSDDGVVNACAIDRKGNYLLGELVHDATDVPLARVGRLLNKYSPTGTLLWNAIDPESGVLIDTQLDPVGIGTDSQNNVYVTWTKGGSEALVAKLSEDGALLWTQTVASGTGTGALGLMARPSGGCVVSFGSGADRIVRAYSATGLAGWEYASGGPLSQKSSDDYVLVVSGGDTVTRLNAQTGAAGPSITRERIGFCDLGKDTVDGEVVDRIFITTSVDSGDTFDFSLEKLSIDGALLGSTSLGSEEQDGVGRFAHSALVTPRDIAAVIWVEHEEVDHQDIHTYFLRGYDQQTLALRWQIPWGSITGTTPPFGQIECLGRLP